MDFFILHLMNKDWCVDIGDLFPAGVWGGGFQSSNIDQGASLNIRN